MLYGCKEAPLCLFSTASHLHLWVCVPAEYETSVWQSSSVEAVEWAIVISTGEEHSVKWRWPQMVNSCLPFSLHTHFFDHNRPKCAFRCMRKESQ